MAPDEVAFEAGVFSAEEGRGGGAQDQDAAQPRTVPEAEHSVHPAPMPRPEPPSLNRHRDSDQDHRLVGAVPPEVWNRLGTKILPKLRSGSDLTIGVDFSVTVKADVAASLSTELRQIVAELGLAETVRVE